MKKKLLISFSGGETSAYMTQWLLANRSDEYEIVVVFANTGQENEETLKFVELCDRHYGFNVVWIEAVPRVLLLDKIVEMCNAIFNLNWTGGRVGTTFKKVNYVTADREGKPFERVIQKYGIPNMSTPHCTRELKEAPIRAYARSLGWKDYYTAIGIRTDEIDRVNPKYKAKKLIYPLVFDRPMTKQKINFWWSQQSFRLNLKGYQGNCITCWKKSDPKLFQIAKENERAFFFFYIMEHRYDNHIPESRKAKMIERGDVLRLPVRFFRKDRSVQDIIEASRLQTKPIPDDALVNSFSNELDFDLVGGESCEVFSECSTV